MRKRVAIKATIFLFFSITVLSACTLDRLFDTGTTSVTRLSDGYVYVEIDSDRVMGLGGPKSESVRRLVEQEAEKKGTCKSGYTIVSDGLGRGYYYFKAKCR